MNEKCQQLRFADSLKSNPSLLLTISFTNIKNTIKWNFVQFWVLNFKKETRKLDFIHWQET